MRLDNGREYINKDISNLLRNKGIYLEPCPPYTHELNGTAKRYNRSIMGTARCLIDDAKINRKYWPEAIKTAAYLKNRTLANTCENKTPYEIFVGKKPNISNLRLYGSKVFARAPDAKRESKWDRKSDIGILLGYEGTGYRVLINGKIEVTRHVQIVEEHENLIGLNFNEYFNDEVLKSDSENDENCDDNELIDKNLANENSDDNEYEINKNLDERLRRSTRERKAPERYNPVNYSCVYVNTVSR